MTRGIKRGCGKGGGAATMEIRHGAVCHHGGSGVLLWVSTSRGQCGAVQALQHVLNVELSLQFCWPPFI